MNPSKKQLKHTLILILSTALLLAYNPALAESDKQMQDKLLRQREALQQGGHAAHANAAALKGPDFKGVYYGYFPCKEEDCSGIKMTLSLKRNNNYLLVTQPAKSSSREFYDKGKFDWDDKSQTLVLTSNKNASKKQYRIEDDSTLVQLSPDGALVGDKDDYTLRRGDTMKSREMHIH